MEFYFLNKLIKERILSKFLLFILINILLLGSSAYANSDLIISGVIDGPLAGGSPKAIEIYVINDVADLSIYGLGVANNGGGTDGEEFTFPVVSANAGDYIYVSNPPPGFLSFFGFSPDYTTGSLALNGDDAIELFKNGIVEDLFGDVNTDGTGQPWEYMDGWSYRNSGSTPSAIFNAADWSFSGPNALDGEANNASAVTPMLVGTFFTGGRPIPTLSEWMLYLLILLLAISGARMSAKDNRVN